MSQLNPFPASWGWSAHVSRGGDRWLYPTWKSLAELTAPCERSLWGQPHQISPVLVATVFGDGLQIIGLESFNDRPNYYVVRVDSRWDLDNWNWSAPEPLIDHLEEVYEAIEDEFGRAEFCRRCRECVTQDEHERKRHQFDAEPWPAADFDIGSSWFLLERLEELEPARV